MSTPKYVLTYHETYEPVTTLTTKIGGQPVWLDRPQWPLSASSGKPMQFIGQILLYPEIFGQIPAQVAYLFMSAETDREWVVQIPQTIASEVANTWDPYGGENAVILQPGVWSGPTSAQATGPCLWKWDATLSPFPIGPSCEYIVSLLPGTDPSPPAKSFVPYLSIPFPITDEEWRAAQTDKIGGTMILMDSQAFPPFDFQEWRLIYQFTERDERFFVNLATDGTGYVLLHPQGTEARFFWIRA